MAFIEHVFAQELVGPITSPLTGTYGTLGGVGPFLTNIIRLIFAIAGIYALFNFITAGFEYINAGGDSKKLSKAWSRIWQSLLGLAIMIGSFGLASLIGYMIFGSGYNILSPIIYGPGN